MMEILNKLSRTLNIPVGAIEKAYNYYWKFIKTKIEELPLKEDLTEEEFNKLRTNFNISNLGKLSCCYPRYKYIKNKYKKDYDKNKES